MILLKNVGIILHLPKRAGNVGSTARVMKNFGIKSLTVVSRRNLLNTFQAKKMAVHAEDVLKHAKQVYSLKEALNDYTIVVGTTGKFHKDAPTLLSPEEMKELFGYTGKNRIAFLFGPEDRGLSGDELALCSYSYTIPTSPDYPSLNLSHAVGVVAYELFKASLQNIPSQTRKLAGKKSLEFVFSKMEEQYLKIGFLDKINPDRIMKLIRSIYERAALDEREVRILLGILKQTDWYINNKS